MKLVIFGLTISSSWGNGHATLWRGLCRALSRHGHRVEFFEHDVSYYAAHRDYSELPGSGAMHLYSTWEEVLPMARRHLADADVGIVTSYCPDGVVATDLVVSSPTELAVFYDLDTPVTLDRLRAGQPVDYIGPRGLRDFDLVLSYTGGKALDALQTGLGAPRVAPLYGSVDPDIHRPGEAKAHFRADLSYLGTYAEDRQGMLETLFIEPSRRMPRKRFLIGGAQYPTEFPWGDNIYFVRHVDPPQHPAFYSSSRLTLNVTRRAMKEMGYCPSGRIFEAAACGAPILSDSWKGIDTFYEPSDEILVADTTTGAMEALTRSPETLEQMARRARERTLAEHTAAHRARELEEVLHRVARSSNENASASSAEVQSLAER